MFLHLKAFSGLLSFSHLMYQGRAKMFAQIAAQIGAAYRRHSLYVTIATRQVILDQHDFQQYLKLLQRFGVIGEVAQRQPRSLTLTLRYVQSRPAALIFVTTRTPLAATPLSFLTLVHLRQQNQGTQYLL